tara:strand:- start:766 stop:996 length:231 start_codon:yes stop_codon:yes gene_type:complete
MNIGDLWISVAAWCPLPCVNTGRSSVTNCELHPASADRSMPVELACGLWFPVAIAVARVTARVGLPCNHEDIDIHA